MSTGHHTVSPVLNRQDRSGYCRPERFWTFQRKGEAGFLQSNKKEKEKTSNGESKLRSNLLVLLLSVPLCHSDIFTATGAPDTAASHLHSPAVMCPLNMDCDEEPSVSKKCCSPLCSPGDTIRIVLLWESNLFCLFFRSFFDLCSKRSQWLCRFSHNQKTLSFCRT